MIWAVFGLGVTVGFLVGVALADALNLYRESRKETTVQKRDMTPRLLTAGLVVVVVVQAVVGVLLIFTRNSTEAYSECTAKWQQQFGEAYVARVDAANLVSEALDDVMFAVDAKDRDAFKASLDQYVKVRQTQTKERAANPLPPLPETLCGER